MRGDKEAAEILDAAVTFRQFLPSRGLSGWFWRYFTPSVARERFEEKLRCFDAMPRHVKSGVIDRLRGNTR